MICIFRITFWTFKKIFLIKLNCTIPSSIFLIERIKPTNFKIKNIIIYFISLSTD